MKKPANPQYTENIFGKSVKVTFDTGNRSSNYPYAQIVTRYDVQLNRDGSYSYRYMRYEGDPLANWQSRQQAVQDLGEDIIAQAEKICTRLQADYEKAIARGRRSWQYKMLALFAGAWPLGYKEDMTVHDAAQFGINNPEEWIGLVRENGTSLHYPGYCTREWLESEVKVYGEEARYYHATRKGIKEITPQKYREFKF